MRIRRTAVRTVALAAAAVSGLAFAVAAPSAYAASPAGALDITGSGDFGTVTVGTFTEQTFTLNGESPALTINGDATLTGANADEFAIATDGCKGQTIDTGQSCDVTVQAAPQDEGARTATLTITDSVGTDHTVALTVNGFWPNNGSFYPVATARILDTRTGNGAPKGAVGAGRTVSLQVTGRGGVPASGVSAVALNVTVTGTTSSGYITAYPSGQSRPTASNINYTKGWTGANQVTVPVGPDGKVNLFNCCGSVSLIADVSGWFAKDVTPPGGVYGKTFQLAAPERLYDSRASGETPLPAHSWIEFPVSYGPTYDPSMTAYVMSVTALNAGSTGYLTAYRPGALPPTSTLNFRPGVVTPNLAIVRTAPCGESWCNAGEPIVRFYNGSSRSVDFLVDAVGFYTDTKLEQGLRYRPLSPTRIIDTRTPLGTNKFGPASTHVITSPASVAGDDTFALSANVTAIKPTVHTFLTLWPKTSSGPRPTISQLNPAAGATVADATITPVGAGNLFNIYNASGSTDLAMDVSGSFEFFPPFTPTPAATPAGSPAAAPGAALRVRSAARPALIRPSRVGAATSHAER